MVSIELAFLWLLHVDDDGDIDNRLYFFFINIVRGSDIVSQLSIAAVQWTLNRHEYECSPPFEIHAHSV